METSCPVEKWRGEEKEDFFFFFDNHTLLTKRIGNYAHFHKHMNLRGEKIK